MIFEVESAPDRDAVKTVEMTTTDLEYSPHFAGKGAAQFERTASSFERSPTAVGDVLASGTACCRGVSRERKTQEMWRISLPSCLSCRSHPNHGDAPPATRLRLTEGSGDGEQFLAINYAHFLAIMLSRT